MRHQPALSSSNLPPSMSLSPPPRDVSTTTTTSASPSSSRSGVQTSTQTIGMYVSTFLCGLLFAVGLAVSGMVRPSKVIGFLDIAALAPSSSRSWDPSLAIVLGAGVTVSGVGFWLFGPRSKEDRSVFGRPFDGPFLATRSFRLVDLPLLLGSIVFGIGWALGGICPGPGFLVAGILDTVGLTFFAGLIGGMLLFRLYKKLREICAAKSEWTPPVEQPIPKPTQVVDH